MDIRFAKRTELMDSSVVRKTLKLTAQPDIISFAGGMPAPEVFPVEAMRAASAGHGGPHGPAIRPL